MPHSRNRADGLLACCGAASIATIWAVKLGLSEGAAAVTRWCCLLLVPAVQGLDAEIGSVRGELKELSGLIKAQEEGLQDFKEVRGAGPSYSSQQLGVSTPAMHTASTRSSCSGGAGVRAETLLVGPDDASTGSAVLHQHPVNCRATAGCCVPGLACSHSSGLQKSQKLLKATDIVVKVYKRNRLWRQNMQSEWGLQQPVTAYLQC